MPNINDINGVTVADIAKLDAVLKANISKVNGLTLSAAAFLLDTYTGASAAYSTRKLKTGVTVAARIRRSGDDIEADVEFDSNNEISLTSPISNASSGTYTDLADFVDHSTTPRDAFVDEWKDQSGSGNHATQSTLTSQPKLYDATTGLITENGKPALELGRDPIKQLTTSAISWSTSFTAATVLQATLDGAFYIKNWSIGTDATNRGYAHIASTGATAIDWMDDDSAMFGDGYDSSSYPRIITSRSAFTSGSQALSFLSLNSTAATLHVDGSEPTYRVQQTGNTSSDSDILYINGRHTTAQNQGMDGTMQELILWASDESSNRTGIETDINSDYLIYQPTDAPTSGLLATYTGAAAAYSVRQLSDKAVIAMRIRRDSDDEERNIGFDSNGDLDTTAISDFCDTANGYVVEWADQSTNGRHATQSTASAQPQIYNGTAVITDGISSIPSIYFNGSNNLTSATYTTISQPITSFASVTFTQASTSWIYNLQGSSGFAALSDSGANYEYWFGGSTIQTGASNSTGQNLPILLGDGANSTSWNNGGTGVQGGDAGSSGSDQIRIGGTSANTYTGYMNEFILYPSDMESSGNRTGVRDNINGYFSIYT